MLNSLSIGNFTERKLYNLNNRRRKNIAVKVLYILLASKSVSTFGSCFEEETKSWCSANLMKDNFFKTGSRISDPNLLIISPAK